MQMRDDPQLRETLYCIRCGACSNSCVNFQQVGGHAFGGETYSGGIATGWEAGVHGRESAASFNDLCTGCSRCVPACPVNIDIPWINVVVRDRINRGEDGDLGVLVDGLRPDLEDEGASLRQRIFAHFETLAKLGSATAPFSNWVNRQPLIQALLEWIFGIDHRRALPAFQRETLRDWFSQRAGSQPRSETSVVLYPDLYTNYLQTSRGKAAVRVLEALGVEVEVPAVPGSGRPPLSQGMIATAERKAQAVWEVLQEPIEAGQDIVVIEPTDLAMFQQRYRKLLPASAASRIREATYDIMDYVGQLVANGRSPERLRQGKGKSVLYHSHCQQRTLGQEAPTIDVLEMLEYDVETSTAECCGMAGSFGYKSEYYELSMEVGEELCDQFVENGSDGGIVIASGTSCQEQLEDLLEIRVRHPIEVIAPE